MKLPLIPSFLALGGILISTAAAATVTILPTQDITLDNGDGNQDGRQHLLVGNNGASGPYTSLIGYDFSGLVVLELGQSIQVNSVTLLMNVTDDGIGGGTANLDVTVQRYNFSFDSTTATYAAPAAGDTTPGGTLGTFYGQVNIPSTTVASNQPLPSIIGNAAFIADVATALTSGGEFNIVLSSAAPSTDNAAYLRLGRISDSGDIPVRILVDYTVIPEPTAGALAGLSLAVLASRRRRR